MEGRCSLSINQVLTRTGREKVTSVTDDDLFVCIVEE